MEAFNDFYRNSKNGFPGDMMASPAVTAIMTFLSTQTALTLFTVWFLRH